MKTMIRISLTGLLLVAMGPPAATVSAEPPSLPTEGQPVTHGLGHHPHGLDNPAPIVALILKHTSVADELAAGIDRHVQQALRAVLAPRQLLSVSEFERLVVTGSWSELWPDGHGGEKTLAVTGRIWNAAIAATLAKHGAAYLPKRNEPYYLDDPIVLKAGQRLSADREAEIRLRPGVNTCMVRNEHIVDGHEGPVPAGLKPDSEIVIEGGVWSTLCFPRQANGNGEHRSARRNGVPGCHGTILLSNVHNVSVRNLTVRHGTGFGVHLSNCREFLVEGVSFEEHGRDGVHVNGSASYGVVRNIHGVTADDFVALNAWDWHYSTPTFGPIDRVLVEGIYGDVRSQRGTQTQSVAEGSAELRVLPGVEKFPNRARLDCFVADCVFRDLHDIRTVKLYDQPNLEMPPGQDFSDPVGTIKNVYFSRLSFCRPGCFQIAATVDGLFVDDVQLDFAFGGDYKLVEIGPMSATWKNKPDDPATWVEVFSPDRDVTVRKFRLTNVRVKTGDTMRPLPDPESRLVKVSDQKPNPDYPKTTPRGGNGKAYWIK